MTDGAPSMHVHVTDAFAVPAAGDQGVTHAVGGGPVVSLDVVRSALRRRHPLWIATGVLGLVVGALLHLVIPQSTSADTTIYRAIPANGGDPDRVMLTDLSLVQTRSVATMALRALDLDMPAEDLLRTVRASSPSNNVIILSVSAPTGGEAVRRADAVAQAFLTFLAQQAADEAEVTLRALRERLHAVEADLHEVTVALDALTSGGETGTRTAAELQELLARRNEDRNDIAELEAGIRAAELGAELVAEGSHVVDRASAAEVSAARVIGFNAVAGLVAGLGLGVGWTAVSAVVTDRLRRREDVAVALGAPVTLNTPRLQLPRLGRRRRLRALVRDPDGPLRLLAEHVAGTIDRADPHAAVLVVPVDDALAGAAVVAAASFVLIGSGEPVAVEDLSRTGALAELVEQPDDDGELRPALVLATLDPAIGARHLSGRGAEAVVLVTGGRSTGTSVANTARLLADAGIRIRSAVLIGTDPTDDSLGLLPGSASAAPRPLGSIAERADVAP